MNYLLIFIFTFLGCSEPSTPKYLKARDEAIEACTKQCSPREMKDWDTWGVGCTCKDEVKK